MAFKGGFADVWKPITSLLHLSDGLEGVFWGSDDIASIINEKILKSDDPQIKESLVKDALKHHMGDNEFSVPLRDVCKEYFGTDILYVYKSKQLEHGKPVVTAVGRFYSSRAAIETEIKRQSTRGRKARIESSLKQKLIDRLRKEKAKQEKNEKKRLQQAQKRAAKSEKENAERERKSVANERMREQETAGKRDVPATPTGVTPDPTSGRKKKSRYDQSPINPVAVVEAELNSKVAAADEKLEAAKKAFLEATAEVNEAKHDLAKFRQSNGLEATPPATEEPQDLTPNWHTGDFVVTYNIDCYAGAVLKRPGDVFTFDEMRNGLVANEKHAEMMDACSSGRLAAVTSLLDAADEAEEAKTGTEDDGDRGNDVVDADLLGPRRLLAARQDPSTGLSPLMAASS